MYLFCVCLQRVRFDSMKGSLRGVFDLVELEEVVILFNFETEFSSSWRNFALPCLLFPTSPEISSSWRNFALPSQLHLRSHQVGGILF